MKMFDSVGTRELFFDDGHQRSVMEIGNNKIACTWKVRMPVEWDLEYDS